MEKEWRYLVRMDVREHFVQLIFQALFPTPSLVLSPTEQRMVFARNVEANVYQTASSQEAYYHILVQKICDLQKELRERSNGQQQYVTVPLAVQPNHSESDIEKRKQIQRQLYLLLHSAECNRREQQIGSACQLRQCTVPHCEAIKNLLSHLQVCTRGKQCSFALCHSSRRILTHWKHCTKKQCHICFPFIQILKRRAQSMKKWQSLVTVNLRKHLQQKVIGAILANADGVADQRMSDMVVAYVRRMEKDIFDVSNSRDEYYYNLAARVYKIQKEYIKNLKQLKEQRSNSLKQRIAMNR